MRALHSPAYSREQPHRDQPRRRRHVDRRAPRPTGRRGSRSRRTGRAATVATGSPSTTSPSRARTSRRRSTMPGARAQVAAGPRDQLDRAPRRHRQASAAVEVRRPAPAQGGPPGDAPPRAVGRQVEQPPRGCAARPTATGRPARSRPEPTRSKRRPVGHLPGQRLRTSGPTRTGRTQVAGSARRSASDAVVHGRRRQYRRARAHGTASVTAGTTAERDRRRLWTTGRRRRVLWTTPATSPAAAGIVLDTVIDLERPCPQVDWCAGYPLSAVSRASASRASR